MSIKKKAKKVADKAATVAGIAGVVVVVIGGTIATMMFQDAWEEGQKQHKTVKASNNKPKPKVDNLEGKQVVCMACYSANPANNNRCMNCLGNLT